VNAFVSFFIWDFTVLAFLATTSARLCDISSFAMTFSIFRGHTLVANTVVTGVVLNEVAETIDVASDLIFASSYTSSIVYRRRANDFLGRDFVGFCTRALVLFGIVNNVFGSTNLLSLLKSHQIQVVKRSRSGVAGVDLEGKERNSEDGFKKHFLC